jgi:chromosome segregation ATPase
MTIDLRDLFEANQSELSKKFIDALLKAMKSKAIKEFDYLKFKHSVKSLSELNLDESTAFKSAFTTASTLGLTKEKLVRTANHYGNVLDKEKLQFAEAMKNQLNEKVSKKLEEAERLKQKTEEYKLKIEKMKADMAAYQKKIQNVDTEIEKAKVKIEATRKNFMDAYELFKQTIEKDINLIDEYL